MLSAKLVMRRCHSGGFVKKKHELFNNFPINAQLKNPLKKAF